jgi:PKD repeat protein
VANVIGWLWNYDDGSSSSEEIPAVHRYREPGVYTVVRTAYLEGGGDVSYSRVVTVNSFQLENLKPDYEKVIYRFGETVEEGMGPSEITGEDFPFLSFGTSALNITDVTGVPRFVVFDNDDRKFYEVSTVGGSSAIGRDIVWRDKCDMYGGNGTEYNSEVHFRSIAGTYERYFVELLSANVYTRAIAEERQGVGVTYDANGYPKNITADISIRADEADGETAESLDISIPKNEIHFDRRVEGHIIQLISTMNKAPHIVTGYNANILNKDKLDSPDKRGQTEEDEQQTLSFNLVNWITRGTGNCDRVTGLSVGIAWAGDSVVGPDGYDGSAFEILESDTLSFTNPSDLRAVFWFQSGTEESSLPVGYEVIGTVSGWVFAQVVSTSITFGDGIFYDLRVYQDADLPANFNTSARTYLYKDIVEYNGSNTLPAWVS